MKIYPNELENVLSGMPGYLPGAHSKDVCSPILPGKLTSLEKWMKDTNTNTHLAVGCRCTICLSLHLWSNASPWPLPSPPSIITIKIMEHHYERYPKKKKKNMEDVRKGKQQVQTKQVSVTTKITLIMSDTLKEELGWRQLAEETERAARWSRLNGVICLKFTH